MFASSTTTSFVFSCRGATEHFCIWKRATESGSLQSVSIAAREKGVYTNERVFHVSVDTFNRAARSAHHRRIRVHKNLDMKSSHSLLFRLISPHRFNQPVIFQRILKTRPSQLLFLPLCIQGYRMNYSITKYKWSKDALHFQIPPATSSFGPFGGIKLVEGQT